MILSKELIRQRYIEEGLNNPIYNTYYTILRQLVLFTWII